MSATFSRRAFLAASAHRLLAAPSSGIIDTHLHFYDPRRPQGVPWPPPEDALLFRPVLPDAFEAIARPLGVTGAIVIEASPWLEDNQWVLDLAAANPIIIGVVGHLEPGSEQFARHLKRFARNRLFRGIRLGGAVIARGMTEPAFLRDLERLASHNLSLDAIGDAAMLPPLATISSKAPTLRIVIDHMPEEPPGWQSSAPAHAALRQLSQNPQVYAKISGVLKKESGKLTHDHAALDEVWKRFGADRVFYGSNWPVSDRVAPYAAVLRVVQEYVGAKGEEASRKFFRDNAKAFYG